MGKARSLRYSEAPERWLAMDKNSNVLNNLQLTIVKFFITFGPGNLEKSRASKKTAENSNAKKKTS